MLPNPSTFEITKRSPRPYRSLLLPASAAATRGTAYIEDTANPGKAKLADGTLPIAGFVTRPVLVGGPTINDAIMPNRIELPFADGDYGSFEHAEEAEAETYGEQLYSGSGGNAAKTITAATPIGTKCSFVGGMFSVAQSNQVAEYYLAEIKPAALPTNSFRARFVLFQGDVQ
jgi:hypothetical protein